MRFKSAGNKFSKRYRLISHCVKRHSKQVGSSNLEKTNSSAKITWNGYRKTLNNYELTVILPLISYEI
jgi:hypothetical protein